MVNSVKKGRGAFVMGKYDQYHSGKPLSAISEAFGEICHRAIQDKSLSLYSEIEAALRAELHDE
eukprot:9111058-Ditylum_brightwellii.AAC.1